MTESLSIFLNALDLGFMQNALLAALLASVACGLIGSLVSVNRLIFLAGGVAHTAYGGVGLAFFLALPVLPCVLGFTLGAALVMATLTRKNRERSDTVIGVLWAAGMAAGILLLDLTPGYNVDLMSYLFGSILAVPGSDLWSMAAMDAAILVLTYFFYKDFLALSFDPEFAEVRGAPVAVLHYLLLAMVALAVVMVIQVVGLILVIALMTIPPAMARQHTSSLWAMMAAACVWSAAFCLVGLYVSFTFDVSSGAAIIATASAAYFASMGVSALVRLARRPPVEAAS